MNNTDAGADAGDGRWMTYGELAAARQIGRRAAIRLAQRHRMQRMPGNDGMARVWVPTDMASSSPHRPTPPVTDADDTPDDTPADVATPFHAQALAALENAFSALREAKDGEIATLRGVIEGLRDNVARSVVLIDLERARADRAEAGKDAAEADRRTAITLADQSVALLTDAAARADRAEAAVAGERSRADALRERVEDLGGRLSDAQAELAAAQDQAEALGRVDDARRALGRWARLRRAWRGE